MIRFLFRLLSGLALSASVVLAVVDVARSVAASALATTPLVDVWAFLSPATLEAAKLAVMQGVGSAVWDVVAIALLDPPGFLVFGFLALLFHVIGYRPGEPSPRHAA